MKLPAFLKKLQETPHQVTFQETMAVIESNYTFTPTAFRNGDTYNEPNQNSGSCKLFAFAKLQQLPKAQTLQCFGDYYRLEVVLKPQGNDHQNIRNFMKFGWDSVSFEGSALQPKTTD